MEEKQYTLFVFTENKTGILHRITVIFTRRKINLDSFSASESERPGIYKFTIVIRTTPDRIEKINKQLEKQVGVLVSRYFENEDIYQQEIALFKMPTKALIESNQIEEIIRNTNSRILSVEQDYTIIETMGYHKETENLFKQLEPLGIMQFARSGRIALSKEPIGLKSYLEEMGGDLAPIFE